MCSISFVKSLSGLLLDPVENDNGLWLDSEGNQAGSFFVDLLGDTWGTYSLLYGENSNFEFGSNFYFTSFNIVCEKPAVFVGKSFTNIILTFGFTQDPD